MFNPDTHSTLVETGEYGYEMAEIADSALIWIPRLLISILGT